VEHLPVLGFTENNTLYTTGKDGGMHDLELCLVCIKEFDTTIYGPGKKGQRVCGMRVPLSLKIASLLPIHHRRHRLFF
jgi:hypothetical protein